VEEEMWLVKTEPGEYSWEQLVRDRVTVWDGVTNAQAVIHLRAMRKGDRVFVYHTGREKAVVGVAEVAGASGPSGSPVHVELRPVGPLLRPVPLAALKALPVFLTSPLVKQGRLSVVPVTAAQGKAIEALGRG
jgi:predicted RNA-binding protein with PUA-like domain